MARMQAVLYSTRRDSAELASFGIDSIPRLKPAHIGRASIESGALRKARESDTKLRDQRRENQTREAIVLFILQLTVLLSGFTAAALWWWASTLKSRTVPSMDGVILREGDLALRYEADKILVWRVSLQNKLNAGAAVSAAVSVALQALVPFISAT